MDNRRSLRPRPVRHDAAPVANSTRKRRPSPSDQRSKRLRTAEEEENQERGGHREEEDEEMEDAARSHPGGGNHAGDMDIDMRDSESEEEDMEEGEEEPLTGTFLSGTAKKGKSGKGASSKQWQAYKKGVIRGAKELPGSLLGHAANAPGRLNQRLDSTKDWVDSHRPPITMEDLLDRLPKPQDEMDEVWTQEREDELVARFEEDGWRAYIEKGRKGKGKVHEHFWSLWRKTCHLRQAFPTDVIGPRQYLQYATTAKVKVKRGVWAADPNWNRNFCETLDFLIIASPCGNDLGLLSLFIRYAVACRINDRRRVPIGELGTGHPFLKELKRVMKGSQGGMTLPAIGEEARRNWERRGMALPWEALTLQQLETVAFDVNREAFRDDSAEFLPYEVVTGDLKAVTEAFRTTTDLGYPIFGDLDDRWKVVSNSRKVNEAPPHDWADLSRLRAQLLLADMRCLEKRRLHGIVGDEPDDFDDGVGERDQLSALDQSSARDQLSARGSRRDSEVRSGGGHEDGGYEHEEAERLLAQADEDYAFADDEDVMLFMGNANEDEPLEEEEPEEDKEPEQPRGPVKVKWQAQGMERVKLQDKDYPIPLPAQVAQDEYKVLLKDIDWSSTSHPLTIPKHMTNAARSAAGGIQGRGLRHALESNTARGLSDMMYEWDYGDEYDD
ncbi:hypothetical protein F4820DRAFT_448243 [Hypoxylon rubiginosum]|uniref:Uncharacterized protein n=1 Tax=Hypoxylon rubiginosum TaxID=110542 RepID=A0ACB9Z0K8_9PEZI|nr:hypothetical protein F4820DRAFT_448243 [Hypoxylon rubiginosum]